MCNPYTDGNPFRSRIYQCTEESHLPTPHDRSTTLYRKDLVWNRRTKKLENGLVCNPRSSFLDLQWSVRSPPPCRSLMMVTFVLCFCKIPASQLLWFCSRRRRHSSAAKVSFILMEFRVSEKKWWWMKKKGRKEVKKGLVLIYSEWSIVQYDYGVMP